MSDLEGFAAGDANAARTSSLSTGRRRRSSRQFFAAARSDGRAASDSESPLFPSVFVVFLPWPFRGPFLISNNRSAWAGWDGTDWNELLGGGQNRE